MRKRFKNGFYIWAAFLLFQGCSYIHTEPIHYPIYPRESTNVEYSLKVISAREIDSIRLFHETAINYVPKVGATFGPPTRLTAWGWNDPNRPTEVEVNFTLNGGYSGVEMVRYKFEVEDRSGYTQEHLVTFALDSFPDNYLPIPIYCQANVDEAFDILFIPDRDIIGNGGLPAFYDAVHSMIENTIHREPSHRFLNRQFNFYLRSEYGEASTNSNQAHVLCNSCTPSEDQILNSTLAGMESIGILHRLTQRDFVSVGNDKVFSSEWNRPATTLHEMGHTLYSLSDEYVRGEHGYKNLAVNNWETTNSSDGQALADGLGRPTDFRQFTNPPSPPHKNWFKICNGYPQDTTILPTLADSTAACIMNSGEEISFLFDMPCVLQIVNEARRNGSN